MKNQVMTAIAQNAPRLRADTDHVESWFVRANDPHSPRAVWIKATVLTAGDGTALAQAWCSVFDGQRTHAWCLDVPLAAAQFDTHPIGQDITVGPLTLSLTGRGGTSAGKLSDAAQTVAWELSFSKVAALGEPMSLLPSDRLLDTPAGPETQRRRAANNEWNVGRTLIRLAFAEIPVVAKHFTVVAGDHDHPRTPRFCAAPLELADQ